MIISNPWGKTVEAQRTDLWRVDLRAVAELVKNPQGVAPKADYQKLSSVAATGEYAAQRAVKVTLPEWVLNSVVTRSNAKPQVLPTIDQPMTSARFEFRHDVPVQGQVTPLVALLTCWFGLAQAGQQKGAAPDLPLLDAASKPVYRCDLEVELLRGSEDSKGLDVASRLVLRRCWLSDLQLPEISYADSDVGLIVASIQTQAIELPQLAARGLG